MYAPLSPLEKKKTLLFWFELFYMYVLSTFGFDVLVLY